MFCSVETDERNDGSASSLSQVTNIHLHAPSGKLPSDPCSTFQ